MRYIGTGALSCAAVMTAFYVNTRKRRRADLLQKLSDFFAAFASFSELSPRDAAKTVRLLAQTRDFGALGFLMPFSLRCKDANVKDVWREEVALFDGASLLTGEERALLAGFADRFGMTSLSAFTEACRKYAALFEGYAEREKQKLEKTGALTVGAGVLAAALIAVVCW